MQIYKTSTLFNTFALLKMQLLLRLKGSKAGLSKYEQRTVRFRTVNHRQKNIKYYISTIYIYWYRVCRCFIQRPVP